MSTHYRKYLYTKSDSPKGKVYYVIWSQNLHGTLGAGMVLWGPGTTVARQSQSVSARDAMERGLEKQQKGYVMVASGQRSISISEMRDVILTKGLDNSHAGTEKFAAATPFAPAPARLSEEQLCAIQPDDISKPEGVISEWLDNQNYWHLECSCSDFRMTRPGILSWCDHLRKFVGSGLDRAHMRDMMVVPIFVKPALEVHILLAYLDNSMIEVSIAMGGDLGHNIPSTEQAAIGMISARSGRDAIRDLVIEYAVEVYSTRLDEIKCQSAFHSKASYEDPDTLLDESGMPSSALVVDIIECLRNMTCRRCLDNNGVPDI